MTAMNPAIIGIVNYRRRSRGPNIATASCHKDGRVPASLQYAADQLTLVQLALDPPCLARAPKIVKNTSTGDGQADSDQTFGQCIEVSACASISAWLCFVYFALV